MKRFRTLIFLMLPAFSLQAQLILTREMNGYRPGDSSVVARIGWTDPGPAGEHVIWDFSGIAITTVDQVYGICVPDSMLSYGAEGENVVLRDEGFHYLYHDDGASYLETGFRNPSRKMTMDYTDPVERMRFPLGYGGQWKDAFEGTGWYGRNSRIDVGGTFEVTADAFGSLVLPDRILHNTLRVKAVKQSLQIGVCGSNQCTIEKYWWYAPGYRYPVLMLSRTTNRYGIREPVYVYVGWLNLGQEPDVLSTTVQKPAPESENAALAWPNPFTDRLDFRYFLRNPAAVEIELYDMAGRSSVMVQERGERPSGLHTGSVQPALAGLKPGVYYLRFTLDGEVIVIKLVKL